MMDGVPQQSGACPAALDRAFHYGDGLFETIAIIQGKPLFWDEHLQRLQAGAQLLQMNLSGRLPWLEDFQQLQEHVSLPERYVLKLILSRGSGGGYAIPCNGSVARYVFASDWPERSAACWHPGILADICPVPLLTGAPYLTSKTLNRLNQVMARNALPQEYAEGVVLDQQGFLREGIMSNLFWVAAGVVHTPSLEEGGIAGIQRQAILNWLQTSGIPCQIGDYRAESLIEAEEIFFSNSLIGIWPVRRFQDRNMAGSQGKISAQILQWQATLGLGPS